MNQSFQSVTDQHIIDVILRPLHPDEGAALGHANKERELGVLFAALPVNEARELHKRLAYPQPDDPLAAAFGRLILERRQRLLDFLADARRRAALASFSATAAPSIR